MTPLQIHGFIKIWSKNTGMTKLKEAFIETVEEKKEIKLVILSKSGGITKVFRLSNNIRSVVLQHCEKRKSHLCLTLQGNILFIGKLSFQDAEQMKMFLDVVRQNKLQNSMKPDDDWNIFESRNTQKEIDKTLSYKNRYKPSYRKMPLLMPKSPTLFNKGLLENLSEKRKKTLPSDLEINEDFLKENNNLTLNKKFKTDSLKYERSNWKEPASLKDLEKGRNSILGSSFKTDSNINPNLEETVLSTQTFSGKGGLAFSSEKEHSQNDPSGTEAQVSFDPQPEKLCEGFPNLGNTCYMNAVLQSLFAIPSFSHDLLMQGLLWEKIPVDAVILPLRQLLTLKDTCDRKIKEELLINVKYAISAVAKIFSGNAQNDAHEFLGQCLDQLKEDIKKLNDVLKTEREPRNENSSPQMYAGNTVTNVCVCPVIANFEFELQLSIICKACGHTVLKTEAGNYLSINLYQEAKPLSLSVQHFFDMFFQAEELVYNCEMCKHKSSVAVNTFSRLPRVLIVHLKRYSFNDAWSLVKNNQHVHIPKYLSLSSYCNESTKSPLSLSNNVPVWPSKVLNASQEIISKIISQLTPSVKSTSESSDSLVLQFAQDKNADLQRFQRKCEEVNQRYHHKDLQNGSKLESKEVNSEDKTVSEKELAMADSVMDLGDTSLPMTCENRDKLIGSQDTDPAETHLQETSENPEFNKCEKTNTPIELDVDTVMESTSGFYEYKGSRILGQSQGMAEEFRQNIETRITEEFLQQVSPPSAGKPDTQEHAEKALDRSTEIKPQKTNLNSLGELGSDENPGNKAILEMENTEAEAKEPNRNVKTRDPLQVYRLISVISHLGSSQSSGHYISDAYDFQKQAWFTYSDLWVSEIQEPLIQEMRHQSGYIFFYMHKEIFAALLEKAENSQPLSTQEGVNLQGE
uniref:Ubiquitin carboxyl-terminal hydrolase n=1 Tax=Otolemur garnettii TaxID=30611 RepID=H0XK90_OTOGA